MADKPTNAFMPNMGQGPFSDYLDPRIAQAHEQQSRQPIQAPNPNGRVPRAAAAAAIIDKFLAGVQSGRERTFLRQQEDQKQQVSLLNAKLGTILNDPTRTDADKQAASQPLYRALGQIMGGAIEQGEQGQKGSGKGKGKGQKGQGGEGQDQGQAPGIGHHVVGMFKELAAGMTGGHFPKELDPKTIKSIVGGALVDSDTILAKAPTLEKLTDDFQSSISKAAQSAQGKPWQEAAGSFDPYRAQAMKIDPSGKLWNQTIQEVQTRFPTGKESYFGQPDKFKADFKTATGRDPSESEVAQGVFGMKPELQGFSSAKALKGSDLSFEKDVNGNPRDPKRYYMERKAGGFQPVDAPRMTAAQQFREDSLSAYRQAHNLEPDAEIQPAQVLDALSEAKTKVQPTDVKKLHALNEQIKEEQVKQFREGTANLETIADGIASHALPPDFSGLRLYGKEGEKMLAMLRKRHPEFNFTEARLDYIGQQAYMRTLNGQQQVSLRQAVNFPMESLNLIDDGHGNGFSPQLSKLVDRTKFPVFNKVAMTAALNGAYGQEAENAARNLEGQITDLQAELAKVYKGGGSPTDKGIEQARKMLDSSWNEESLRTAVELSKTNLGIRLSSIHHTLPYSIGESGGQASNRISQRGTALSVNNISGIKGPDGSFVEYKSPGESYQATVADLQAKISGRTSTGLNGSAPLSQLVNIWTTGEGTGAGQQYSASDVVKYLNKRGLKIKEDTPIGEIPAAQLGAAISHFETGYEVRPEEVEKADITGRAERNSGGANPFRKPSAPNPSANPPGAGVDLSKFDKRN